MVRSYSHPRKLLLSQDRSAHSPLFIDYKANGRSLTFQWPIKYLSKEAPHTIVKSGIIAFACEMISKLHPDHLTVFRTPYQVLFFKRFRILFLKVLVLYYRFENKYFLR